MLLIDFDYLVARNKEVSNIVISIDGVPRLVIIYLFNNFNSTLDRSLTIKVNTTDTLLFVIDIYS